MFGGTGQCSHGPAMKTGELGSARVTWHDVVDGTASMISNPMYGRRADITPSPRKVRGRSCKVGKTSCVLWACLVTATMLICITAVVFAMIHNMQVRAEEAENRIAALEKTLLGDRPVSDPLRQVLPPGSFGNTRDKPLSVGTPETPAIDALGHMGHRGESGPPGPPGPLGEPGTEGPPGSPNPLLTATANPVTYSIRPEGEGSSDAQVSEGSGNEQDEGHLDSEGPDDSGDDVM